MVKRICEISNRILRCASSGLNRLNFIKGVTATFLEFAGTDNVSLFLGDRERLNRFVFVSPSFLKIIPCKNPRFPFDFFTHNNVLDRTKESEFSLWLNSFFQQSVLGNKVSDRSFSLDKAVTDEGICFYTNNCPIIEKTHPSVHSFYLIPFVIDPYNYAILIMDSDKSDAFNRANINFFSKLIQTLSDGFSHQFAQDALRERVKELSCLYQITQIANMPNLTISQILQRIADILPLAMQYPEIANARIFVDGETYLSRDFRESKVKLLVKISSKYEDRGFLEIFYNEKELPPYGQIFLLEEENLIEAVSKQIALILERKQVEEINQKLQEQLRHADRLATIGQLSAGIAHEINEPLGTILGFAQLIEKDKKTTAETLSDIKKIINATLHGREIIRKLMLFSRQMPPKISRVAINQIIEDGLYFLESRCQKSGIEIVKTMEENVPEIDADPNQIHQVLVNLIVNAIHSMPDGGKLWLMTKQNSDNTISFVVEDSGIGIPENIRNKIFIPFFTTKDINQGTGLGLSVVHGIISSHKGSIEVKSEVGKGSSFEIKLPISKDYN